MVFCLLFSFWISLEMNAIYQLLLSSNATVPIIQKLLSLARFKTGEVFFQKLRKKIFTGKKNPLNSLRKFLTANTVPIFACCPGEGKLFCALSYLFTFLITHQKTLSLIVRSFSLRAVVSIRYLYLGVWFIFLHLPSCSPLLKREIFFLRLNNVESRSS